MKLHRIQATNFLSLRNLDLDLSGAAFHIVCGPNNAGKTSLQEAIRFALLGETARVALKKDYKAMVSDGAKSGSVAVMIDAETEHDRYVTFVRDVATGKREGDAAWEMDSAAYVLDAQRFATLDANARRSFLFGLMGIETGTDEVRKRLQARECDVQKIEAALPLLRSGFESASKDAAKRATEAKGAWRGVTGENYGEKKADTWTAPTAIYDLDAHNAAAKALREAETKLGELHGIRGQVQAAEQQAKALRDAKQAIARLPAARKELDALISKVEAAQVEMQTAKVKQMNLEAAPTPHNCPACGVALTMNNGKLVELGEDAKRPSQSEVAEAIRTAAIAAQNLRKLRDQAESLSREVVAGEAAEKLLAQAAEAQQGLPSIEEIEQGIADAKAEIAALRDKVRIHEQAAAAASQADTKNRQAAQYHRDVLAWTAIADALAPDGIPGEMLAEALGPINARLRVTAQATGWKQVVISADMEITAEGRPYALCSESERWRTDAAIAEAIAHLSGMRLLVLDRFDVLDVQYNRPALFGWLHGFASEYDTIMVCGTLKQMPTNLPPTMQAHWLEDGKLVVLEQDKAA